MSRYLVALAAPFSPGDDLTFHDIHSIVPCDSAVQVQKAIDSNRCRRRGDWQVFEAADGRFEPRVVVFERDGKTVRSIS